MVDRKENYKFDLGFKGWKGVLAFYLSNFTVITAIGSDKGPMLETSALKLLQWPIYVMIQLVDNTKFLC